MSYVNSIANNTFVYKMSAKQLCVVDVESRHFSNYDYTYDQFIKILAKVRSKYSHKVVIRFLSEYVVVTNYTTKHSWSFDFRNLLSCIIYKKNPLIIAIYLKSLILVDNVIALILKFESKMKLDLFCEILYNRKMFLLHNGRETAEYVLYDNTAPFQSLFYGKESNGQFQNIVPINTNNNTYVQSQSSVYQPLNSSQGKTIQTTYTTYNNNNSSGIQGTKKGAQLYTSNEAETTRSIYSGQQALYQNPDLNRPRSNSPLPVGSLQQLYSGRPVNESQNTYSSRIVNNYDHSQQSSGLIRDFDSRGMHSMQFYQPTSAKYRDDDHYMYMESSNNNQIQQSQWIRNGSIENPNSVYNPRTKQMQSSDYGATSWSVRQESANNF